MRVVQNSQMQIGEVDISQIKFDPKSRDDIPKILKGLQHLYVNLPLRKKIFALLEAEISPKVRHPDLGPRRGPRSGNWIGTFDREASVTWCRVGAGPSPRVCRVQTVAHSRISYWRPKDR